LSFNVWCTTVLRFAQNLPLSKNQFGRSPLVPRTLHHFPTSVLFSNVYQTRTFASKTDPKFLKRYQVIPTSRDLSKEHEEMEKRKGRPLTLVEKLPAPQLIMNGDKLKLTYDDPGKNPEYMNQLKIMERDKFDDLVFPEISLDALRKDRKSSHPLKGKALKRHKQKLTFIAEQHERRRKEVAKRIEYRDKKRAIEWRKRYEFRRFFELKKEMEAKQNLAATDAAE